MTPLPWQELERAKITVDGLRSKVRSFLRPEEAAGREVPTFFTKVFTFNNYPTNGALSPSQEIVSQQILNDTAQLVRLTSMSYDINIVGLAGAPYRPRMVVNGILGTFPTDGGTFLPIFDFEWNLRHESTQRDYSVSFMSRESLGNPEKGNHLTFPCYLELERSDNLTISIKPTVMPTLLAASTSEPNIRTIKLYITLAGYRVRS